jgi:hypothetical protein
MRDKHCVSSFCYSSFGSNQSSEEVGDGSSSWLWKFHPVGCGSLWSAPTAGKPVGNEPFVRMDGPGYSMTCEREVAREGR